MVAVCSFCSEGARAWAGGGLMRSRRPAAERSGGAHARQARQPKACQPRVPTSPSRAKSAATHPGPSAQTARVPTPQTAWLAGEAKTEHERAQGLSTRTVSEAGLGVYGPASGMRVCLPRGRWALCERRRGGYEARARLGLAGAGFVGPTRLVDRMASYSGDASVGPAAPWASTPDTPNKQQNRGAQNRGHL